MTNEVTQQDRDALAEVLESFGYGVGAYADAILASDWLAEHVRAAKAEAWDEGWMAHEPTNPYLVPESSWCADHKPVQWCNACKRGADGTPKGNLPSAFDRKADRG